MDQPNEPLFQAPIRKQLPTVHYTEIGRIVFIFALIEGHLRHIIYTLSGLGSKRGRLILRNQRAAERIALIKDLAALRKIELRVNWGLLTSALKQVESFRDRFAHAVWIKHPHSKSPVLQDFSTDYIPNIRPGTKPKITPLAVEVPLEKLKDIRRSAFKLSKQITKLELHVLRTLKTSRRK